MKLLISRKKLLDLEKPLVPVAENFKTFASNISHEGLNAIQKTFTYNSSDSPNAMMMVINHLILDLILDVLNAFEINELILVGSVFIIMIKVQQNIIIVLIAELDELNDDMNLFFFSFS
jgi:hypothetical protein